MKKYKNLELLKYLNYFFQNKIIFDIKSILWPTLLSPILNVDIADKYQIFFEYRMNCINDDNIYLQKNF